MTMIIQIVTAIALILSIILPVSYFFLGEKNKKRYKRTLAANCFMFFGVILVASVVMLQAHQAYRLHQATAVWLQVLAILQLPLLQVFPVLVPVLQLPAPQALRLEPSAKTVLFLVNLLSS